MAPIRWYITCQAMFTFNRYNYTIFDMSGYLPSIQTCLQQVLNRYWQQSQVWHAYVVYMLMHAHACSCPCVCEFTSTHMTGCPCAGNLSACLPPCLKHGHLLWSLCTRDWLVLGRIGFSCLHVPSQGGCTGITSVWFTVQLYGGARGSKLCSLALVWWQVLCLLPTFLGP